MLRIKQAAGYQSLQETPEEIWKQRWLLDDLLQTQDSNLEGGTDLQAGIHFETLPTHTSPILSFLLKSPQCQFSPSTPISCDE